MSPSMAIKEARRALRTLEKELPNKEPSEVKRILTVVKGLQEDATIPTTDVTPQFMLKDSLRLYPMSQTELAEKLGISKTVVSDLVNGRRSITVKWAKRLGKVLRLNYKALL
ncbi:MAG TPA: helix-turn-helix domain-containing protein [Bdellovibrionota bacterium]|nr:helix-turn-helix domain-containing protein [Bdellovibrionota bacterium]